MRPAMKEFASYTIEFSELLLNLDSESSKSLKREHYELYRLMEKAGYNNRDIFVHSRLPLKLRELAYDVCYRGKHMDNVHKAMIMSIKQLVENELSGDNLPDDKKIELMCERHFNFIGHLLSLVSAILTSRVEPYCEYYELLVA